MIADLHIHSTFSDGSMSVEDIVFYAKKMNLDAIAITDHDTLAGARLAVKLAEGKGLEVIPGVEMTTRDTKRDRPVHLLCYMPVNPEPLEKLLNKTLENRAAQKRAMIKKVQELYPVATEHIERYSSRSKSIYESHIMQALADLGYTNTPIGPLMDELLSKKGSCYVPSKYPDVREALNAIHESGGIAVIAHPGQFHSLELLEELACEGSVQGAEYNHPRNSEGDKVEIMRIADRYGLVLTGGTDFHGLYSKTPYPLGSFTCPPLCIERLRMMAGEASRARS
jgi:PHP domain.